MTNKKTNNRRYFSATDKVRILRLHLLEKVSVSEVCQKFDLQPTVFYRWQKQFFENGEKAFVVEKSRRKPLTDKIENLRRNLSPRTKWSAS